MQLAAQVEASAVQRSSGPPTIDEMQLLVDKLKVRANALILF